MFAIAIYICAIFVCICRKLSLYLRKWVVVMPAGRPRKYNSVKEMQVLINAYFEHCDNAIGYKYTKNGDEYIVKKPKPYTVQGLAVYLGICMDTLLEYSKLEEFSETIKEAKSKIEANKVEGMISGDWNATGVIFDLKNNHDWKDKTEVDNNVSGGLNNTSTIKLTDMSDEDLRKMAEMQEKYKQ